MYVNGYPVGDFNYAGMMYPGSYSKHPSHGHGGSLASLMPGLEDMLSGKAGSLEGSQCCTSAVPVLYRQRLCWTKPVHWKAPRAVLGPLITTSAVRY